ncbi:MAG: hypothetical protein AAGN35_07300 [Bacteroidota bacterium]
MKAFKIFFFAICLTGFGSLFAQSSDCWTTLDFSKNASGNALAAGTVVSDQFSGWGITVQAKNNKSAHPDKAVIFNSARPTGGDTDLGTPNERHGGPGVGEGGESGIGVNDQPLGNLLIVAENDRDGDGDGLIDESDDEAAGGTLIFRFERGASLRNLVLVDIDANERGAVLTATTITGEGFEVPITGNGDNSIVRFDQTWEMVQYFEVKFPGSGAVASFDFCMP